MFTAFITACSVSFTAYTGQCLEPGGYEPDRMPPEFRTLSDCLIYLEETNRRLKEMGAAVRIGTCRQEAG